MDGLGNIWLQRVSLIFQLTYKDKTDAELLFDYVKRLAESKEFFLQKAVGWALRQYGKTNPAVVKKFVENTPLSPLTRREALKNILQDFKPLITTPRGACALWGVVVCVVKNSVRQSLAFGVHKFFGRHK